jgi:hypothetical protein
MTEENLMTEEIDEREKENVSEREKERGREGHS